MFKIFNKFVFWHRHDWALWSEPIDAEKKFFTGQTFFVQIQMRKCETCGKIEIQQIGR